MRPSSAGSKTIAAPAAISTVARSVLAARDDESAAPRTQRHPAPGSTAGSATDAIAASSAPPSAAMSAARAQVAEQGAPDGADGIALGVLVEVRRVGGVCGDELAEPRHDRGDEQAAAGDREADVDERAAQTAGQQGGAQRGDDRRGDERPAPAGEGHERMGRRQLEPLRVQPQHGGREVLGDAAGDRGGDAADPLEERSLAERQAEAERRVAAHQRAVARRERAVHHAPEHRRVRDRTDQRHEERAHDEGVGHRAARQPGDDLVGDDAAHGVVAERGRDPRRELLVVDERGVGVPRDRRPGEQQRGQDDHDEGGRPAHARTLSGRVRRALYVALP